jgi:hypothetical protein
MNNGFEGMWNEVVMAQFKLLSGIFLEGLMKTEER